MTYHSLTIHCASLCLDVMSAPHFWDYTESDIVAFKEEVVSQIKARLSDDEKANDVIEPFASGVLKVLIYSHLEHTKMPPASIIDTIQQHFDDLMFYKTQSQILFE
ncbi:hypothetical protein [Shewanella sp.]|uniref:hypothetical protein n=1 Tax=Shewanella sp. TaxID=50422 RepID=UPI003A97651C